MLILILGLVIFFAVHSMRLYAGGWRDRTVASMGLGPWKGVYSLVAIVGLVLIIWGYGDARMSTPWVWMPPVWTRHLAALLTIPAFILIVATYIPGTYIKAKVGHPMLLGVKIWATAHLLAKGSLVAILLFGSFLIWSIVLYAVLRRRDRAAGITYPPVSPLRDLLAVVLGLVAWAVFAMYLHGVLIGVRPFG